MTDRPKAGLVIITEAHNFQTIRPEDTPDEFIEAIENEVFGFVCEHCDAPTHSRVTIRKDGRLSRVCPKCFHEEDKTNDIPTDPERLDR